MNDEFNIKDLEYGEAKASALGQFNDETRFGLVDVQLADTCYALKNDGYVFIDFYLHSELLYPIPEFHIQVWNMMIDVQPDKRKYRKAPAVPRGHAKTTMAK